MADVVTVPRWPLFTDFSISGQNTNFPFNPWGPGVLGSSQFHYFRPEFSLDFFSDYQILLDMSKNKDFHFGHGSKSKTQYRKCIFEPGPYWKPILDLSKPIKQFELVQNCCGLIERQGRQLFFVWFGLISQGKTLHRIILYRLLGSSYVEGFTFNVRKTIF